MSLGILCDRQDPVGPEIPVVPGCLFDFLREVLWILVGLGVLVFQHLDCLFLLSHLVNLFLLVFLVDQGFLETLACLVILAHPVALEPLADLAHQGVPRWFVLRQTGLESGSELSYILPYDLG